VACRDRIVVAGRVSGIGFWFGGFRRGGSTVSGNRRGGGV
jgi:hypothetical protein